MTIPVVALVLALLAGPALAQPLPALRLPGAGPVAAVIETRVRDGFDQRIRYEGGDGRNHAEIALRNETGDLLLAFPPRLAKPSQFGIEGEIAVRFPGQVMRVLPPRRNAYGPVGIALGPDCLYAWQWFERPRPGARIGGRDELLGASEPAPVRRALSLRVRLCRTAQASLNELVAAVEHMTIALPGEGAAPAAPAARPQVRRRPPAPRATPRPDEAAPAAPPARPRTPPQARPQPPAEQAPAPPPPATETGRRYIAPRTPEQRAPDAAPAPEAAPPRSGSQRYITDGPPPAEPPGGTPAPSPAPGRGAGESLSRDLPPEAYRPPPERSPAR